MIDIPFFEALPVLPRFEDTANPANYLPVPNDWIIAITDVRGSTLAIEQGRYKEVNAMGAISIMGVLNITQKFNFPFVFGGDGATIAIPGSMRNEVSKALRGVQKLASEQFKLDVRAGLVPVSEIRSNGFDVRVARLAVSSYFTQAAFMGGGTQFADKLLKSSSADPSYFVENEAEDSTDDFNGLECRWDEVRNERGEVHSILVDVTVDDERQKNEIYRQIYDRIALIYGDEKDFTPVTTDKLNLTLNNRKLAVERKVRTFGTTRREQILYWIKLRVQWFLGKILMRFSMSTERTNWGDYKSDLAANTDFRKFDDMLRMVLAGNEMQRFTLQGYLESLYEKGLVIYGIHTSDSALITCMILDHQKGHIHLVDGNDGGYTMAAKRMKDRAKARTER